MHRYLKIATLTILVTAVLFLSAAPAAGTEGMEGFIVVFYDDVDPDLASQDLEETHSAEVLAVYRHAIKGSYVLATQKERRIIENDRNVWFVEDNQTWSIDGQTVGTGITRTFSSDNPNIWINGLDDYTIDVDVAVIDTGIDLDHPDLDVVSAIDCSLSGPWEGTCDGFKDDGNGHGTHVAGIIGALDNDYGVVGVAPGARLWAVKVLTNYGTGTTAQVIAGIDWVAAHADDIEIANMSLGGVGESVAMDLAISDAVELGVTFVLAAGNRAIDVNNYHPAGNPDAITVSALADFNGLPGGGAEPTCRVDIDDTLADFSNFGAGVDIAAPGACIYSTDADGTYSTRSGTSMAAPHVAGAAALLASTNPGLTPDEIKTLLIDNGNYDWTDDSPDGIQEPLLDVSNLEIYSPVVITTTPYPITLTADAYKVAAFQVTDLYWESELEFLWVDIYRDGIPYDTAENSGFYTDDDTGIKGVGFHSYRVCEYESTETCSANIRVFY